MSDLTRLIDTFTTVRAAFLAAPDDDDCNAKWDAYCKAEDAVINASCETIEDVRLKAQFFLDHEAPHDTLRNCFNNDGWALDRFLRSLMGEGGAL